MHISYSRIEEDDSRLVTGSGRWDDGHDVYNEGNLLGILLVNWENPKEGEFLYIPKDNSWNPYEVNSGDYTTLELATAELEGYLAETELAASA